MDKSTNPNDQESPVSRRNRLAGLWAAELMGLIGQAAHDYVHDLARHHEESRLEARLAHDLKGRRSLAQVREKLAHLMEETRRQLGR